MNEWQVLEAGVAGFALAVPRLAAAFMVLPLLTQESIQPMVRNIFLVSLALIVYPLIARTRSRSQPSRSGRSAWSPHIESTQNPALSSIHSTSAGKTSRSTRVLSVTNRSSR